ncbi:carbohydrate ABC transporter permease [Amycolatopsis pigmentata]|uniref:Carbohydrate ABC transporter permease n=1 Tax=Amycolatopsis pigmentata TaxID=450801 RepID=A0ABW5FWY8_9PSEU
MTAVLDQKVGTGKASEPRRALGHAAAWARRAPLLPALVFLVIVTQLPFVGTLVISLLRWNALNPTDTGFVGIENYITVFSDSNLRDAVLNTIELTVVVILVSLVLGLLLALLLDRKFKGRPVVRTLLIAPFLVVPAASALLWKHALFNPVYGLFNGVLTWFGKLFGNEAPVQFDWITTMPKTAVEISLIWQWTPFMMLILLAGLQSKPVEAFEAAQVDGARGWQMFRYLTFPHLRQYMELAALLGSIYIVQNFDAVFTITSGSLGTANLPYAIYETFYRAHDYGVASASGVVVVVGSIVIATFALRVVLSLFREEVKA